MREVEICLQMLEPCLSGIKNKDENGLHFVFNRNASGEKALIMQKEWQRLLRFACKAISVSTRLAESVWFDPVVDGPISTYQRPYKDKSVPAPGNRFKVHEAFLAGAQLTVRAVIRPPLNLDKFKRILIAGGRYAGLTAVAFGEYGRFEVISVK